MRTIDRIVIHCSATRVSSNFTEDQVKGAHLPRGFRTWGYHYYIRKDGRVIPMRPIEQMGAHATGYNASSIGVCYEGGLDITGKPADTRTSAQKQSMLALLQKLMSEYKIIHLDGHRDLSPDLNDNGIVEPSEYIKMCPCFSVHDEYSSFLRDVIIHK